MTATSTEDTDTDDMDAYQLGGWESRREYEFDTAWGECWWDLDDWVASETEQAPLPDDHLLHAILRPRGIFLVDDHGYITDSNPSHFPMHIRLRGSELWFDHCFRRLTVDLNDPASLDSIREFLTSSPRRGISPPSIRLREEETR